MNPGNIEALRQIFKDKREWIGIGVVTATEMAKDRSVFRARVELFPDGREIVAVCSSAGGVGPSAGSFMFCDAGDLVLTANANGDDDSCYVIANLTSKEDKIPANAAPGVPVIKARAGKKAWITSDTKINLSAGDPDPTEAVVLGNVLKTFMEAFFDAILNAPSIGICAVGPVALDPAIRTQLVAQKTQYLSTAASNILSQLTFTERGGS
jgi:hypothetical protein